MSFKKVKEFSGHSGAVYSCLVRGNYIYSCSADKFLGRWLLNEGVQDKFSIKFESSVYTFDIIYDKLLVVGLSNGGLYFIDIETREEIQSFNLFGNAIFSITHNKHTNQIYVGDSEGNLMVWSSTDLKLLLQLPLNSGKIRKITIQDRGDYIGLACQDGSIRIFDTNYFNETNCCFAHENGTTAVLFHPSNEDLIISGGKDALLKLWNWKNETQIHSVVAHRYAIYDILPISNYTQFASASRDKNIKIWDIEKFSFVDRLDLANGGHIHSVNKLSGVDQHSFISCSDDKKILLWEKK